MNQQISVFKDTLHCTCLINLNKKVQYYIKLVKLILYQQYISINMLHKHNMLCTHDFNILCNICAFYKVWIPVVLKALCKKE